MSNTIAYFRDVYKKKKAAQGVIQLLHTHTGFHTLFVFYTICLNCVEAGNRLRWFIVCQLLTCLDFSQGQRSRSPLTKFNVPSSARQMALLFIQPEKTLTCSRRKVTLLVVLSSTVVDCSVAFVAWLSTS